ncbi:transcriptional regulator, Crp/Fnr family [Gluconacetobacter diazotrophicus PA1 5]|uniref:Helix-turn-helix domain-containing protein n=2 Tax=Gluconacetobacter diazotrophicus TaxID=33996 RepID=A0A7W4FCF3_GLUDI|nr:helix-turn-helix domain-containing protein [Gluconacetobacter diazotrophicus]ACI51744.1 transcriptional regulator, Crp/Fnr family [Gluconacetobacter diazotrophicus PA1 5]MBB2155216.1 helix-turn-helix domain-containing protein [Gluconacetobacter diazotrophicus]TWB11088.1 CRP/FNR family transcriptional regulator [Gluconacetobacter diazotrophicus]CAP55216.1 putative transcriptional activatory [Gluconacetobacter diazotrophicus PA1 5]
MSDQTTCERESRPRRLILAGAHRQPGYCLTCGVRPRSVCSAISDDDIVRLAETAVETLVLPGRAFVEEGAPATDFFSITSGNVKLFKALPDGRRQITGFAGAGHFLGLAVTDQYAFGAEAVDTVRLCRFSRARMRHLMDDFPRLERRLLEEASNELVAAQNQMLLLGRKTARERVASFLLDRVRDMLNPSGDVPLPMTRSDIADYLGLTIETVSRTLSWMRTERLITIGKGHTVRITAMERLESLASGNS